MRRNPWSPKRIIVFLRPGDNKLAGVGPRPELERLGFDAEVSANGVLHQTMAKARSEFFNLATEALDELIDKAVTTARQTTPVRH